MLKKSKNSFIFICLISLLTGCVNQNQEVQTNEEVTIAATSVSVTEILDQLDVPAKQVVGEFLKVIVIQFLKNIKRQLN